MYCILHIENSNLDFLLIFFRCSYWVHYGMLSNESSVVLVNCIGVTLFLIYTLIYYIFTVNKNAYVKQFLFVLTALFGIVFYINTIPEQIQATNFMGKTLFFTPKIQDPLIGTSLKNYNNNNFM